MLSAIRRGSAAAVGDIEVINSLELATPEGDVLLEVGLSWYFFPAGVRDSFQDGAIYPDICGRNLRKVVPRTGWYGKDELVLARCTSEEGVLAAGWAMGIGWRDSGEPGVNLSYAVVPEARGRGLATLAAAAALLTFYDMFTLSRSPVNAQADQQNAASVSVARKLGLQPTPMRDFEVPELGRRYVGFGGPAEVIIERCQRILLDADEASTRRLARERCAA